MALEFICSTDIEKEKSITIPEECNAFRIKSGEIRFFKYNPTLHKGIKKIQEIK